VSTDEKKLAKERPHLSVLLGAGSTVGAGIPSTQEITEYVLSPDDELGGVHTDQLNDFVQKLVAILQERGKYKSITFELILHAIEQLEPLLGFANGHDVNDYYRNVLQSFVEIPPAIRNDLTRNGVLGYNKGGVIRRILRLIHKRLEDSERKEKHLSELLLDLNEHFVLKVFTLNYDNLVDLVKLPWADGFVPNNSNFYLKFDAKTFLASLQNDDPLLVHLHGSTHFGYSQEGIFEIHKYVNPTVALNHTDTKGFTNRNIHGRPYLSGPIISGYSKVEQLFFRPVPYGYYLHGFVSSLLSNCRLFILGYGGWDAHINDWILQFLEVHKTLARIAYVAKSMTLDPQFTGSPNRALTDRIMQFFPRAQQPDQIPLYQDRLLLESAEFPFNNADLLDKITTVLA
jgi:hypothetical protein